MVTAAVVGARLTGSLRRTERPVSDHVIVAGLGNVGTRIFGQLHDLGVGVVCVDKNEDAAGVRLARRLGLRVVIGETHREETLRAAGVATCQALVSVTNSDIVNLETALHARALPSDLRMVFRLDDDDLAERVQKTVGNTISRSVPYLAAPRSPRPCSSTRYCARSRSAGTCCSSPTSRSARAPNWPGRRSTTCTRPATCG